MKKRKIGLRFKFAGLFVIFAAIIMVSTSFMTYQNYREAMMQKYADEGITVAKLAVSYLDGDEMLRYNRTRKKDAGYYELKKTLDNIKERSGVLYLYVLVPVGENESRYIFDAGSEEEVKANLVADLGDFNYWDDNFKLAKEAMKTGEPSQVLEPTNTEIGYLASVYAPIKDSTGKAVAVVGVDFTMDEIQTFLKNGIQELLIMTAGVILGCFLLLLLLINGSIITPIHVLKDSVERMSDGELGVQVPIKSGDEIGEISEVFNRMSFNIGSHIQEVTALNEGYYKFVPSVFFDMLNRKSVREVQLGDNRKVPLEVLSMQVNDFDRHTRKMEAEEVFGFVNRIYQLCVPIIMENKGVIDSYDKDGFSAIYTEVKKHALDSAVSICQKFNEKKKFAEDVSLNGVEIAFGISRGTPMVGIVGHAQRLAAVAMSEQISIVDYLKKVAHKYHARILITGTAANAIPGFSERYHARMLGFLHISVSDSLEKIYDVYDGDEQELHHLKDLTKEKFEEGVQLFMAQEFYDARRCFVEVLKISQSDYAAREYLYLCNQYYVKEENSEIHTYIEDF